MGSMKRLMPGAVLMALFLGCGESSTSPGNSPPAVLLRDIVIRTIIQAGAFIRQAVPLDHQIVAPCVAHEALGTLDTASGSEWTTAEQPGSTAREARVASSRASRRR